MSLGTMGSYDDVIAQLAAIQNEVKNNQHVNWDQARIDFEAKLKEYTDLQVKSRIEAELGARVKAAMDEYEKNRPQYRIGSTYVLPDGTTVDNKNKYYGYLSAFQKDGFAQVGNQKVLPIDLFIAKAMIDAGFASYPERFPRPASSELNAVVKSLTSTGVGTGDEIVPTNMADMLWMDLFLAARVAAAVPSIPMTSDPMEVPLGFGAVTWKKGTQNVATAVSDPPTAKSILTSTEIFTYQRWSYTLDEDAVIAVMPALREELIRSGGEQIDAFILNADSTNAATGNINLVDADPADDEYYLSDGQDGLRHLWLVDNTAQQINAAGAALTDANLVSCLAKLDKYAADPSQCAIACDVGTYLGGFLSSAATAPGQNVLTIDKIGPQALVRTGVMAMYRGIDIIPSAQYLKTNANGVRSVTPANNVLGSLTLFNRNQWKLGFRRNLLVETDRDITTRSILLVTSFRLAIAARGARATAIHTAGVRNILV